MFCDRVLIFDHLKQQVTLVHHIHVPEKAEEATLWKHYRRAVEELEERAEGFAPAVLNWPSFSTLPLRRRGSRIFPGPLPT